MNNQETIEVTGSELEFIFKNEPKAFPSLISTALKAEGHNIDRVKIHNELRTIKPVYNRLIITKARELLKTIQKVEYQH